MKRTLIASALMGIMASTSVMADEETQQLRDIIEKQKQVLADLERRLEETEKRLDMTVDVVEKTAESTTAAANTTTIGGYGELHYNNLKDDNSGERDRSFDFHRFVLFFGHEFNSKTRFFSELELEHSIAGEGKDGEIELEQAYIEHDINEQLTAKAGLFLMPVGLINETHEPPTFYGTERNPIEKNIIPATWWEGGLAMNVKVAPGFSVDAAVTSGLKTPIDGSNAFKIRNGRQKVSEADGRDLAYTGRVKYTAIPGLELAATLQYQSNLAQSAEVVDEASATLFTAHAAYQKDAFGLKALYAQWDIDGAEAESFGRDKQKGYFIEPSYRLSDEFGVFARYSAWDNNAGDNNDTEIKQTNLGVNYWLHEDVVFKFDLEKQSGAKDVEGFNMGVGYQF